MRAFPAASALIKSAPVGLSYTKFQNVVVFLPGGPQLLPVASISTLYSKNSVPLYENEVSPQMSFEFMDLSAFVPEPVKLKT